MNIILKRLSASGSGNVVRLDFEISDGEHMQRDSFNILSEQYAVLRPAKGEIDTELFDTLHEASEICECYLKALNILSFGDNNMYSLKMKLARRGFSRDIAEKTVRLVSEKGYIREENVAAAEVKKCLAKLWGRNRIIAQLRSKGFDSVSIEKALIFAENTDFTSNCRKLAKKKFGSVPDDPQERRKMIASLVRYGYSMEEIRHALSRLG